MIATERLDLRPPATDDLPWILEHMNTPAVMRNLGGVRTPDKVAEGLASDIGAFAEGGYRRWTIWLREQGLRIGRCGLFHVKTEAAPDELRGQHEIGWTLAEGFDSLGLAIIHAQTSASNRSSTRLMQRLGFARLAAFDYLDPDYPAADNPTTVYGLTREKWGAGK
jgi:RimJ/RimL family protein N-acetyltransferase